VTKTKSATVTRTLTLTDEGRTKTRSRTASAATNLFTLTVTPTRSRTATRRHGRVKNQDASVTSTGTSSDTHAAGTVSSTFTVTPSGNAISGTGTVSDAQTWSASMENDPTETKSVRATTASFSTTDLKTITPSRNSQSKTSTSSALFDVEGIRIVLNGTAEMWRRLLDCCLESLQDVISRDVAVIAQLSSSDIVVRRMIVSSLIVYFNIQRKLEMADSAVVHNFCDRLRIASEPFPRLALFLRSSNVTVGLVDCRNVYPYDSVTDDFSITSTEAVTASRSQTASKLLQHRSTRIPSATQTFSTSSTDYIPKVEVVGKSTVFGATLGALITPGSNWSCSVLAVVIVVFLLLWSLITVLVAFLRRRCCCWCTKQQLFPRAAFAHLKWLSLVCEHVFISAVLPCHHLCAHIHALHLSMHVMVMASVAAALLQRLPAPSAPLSSAIIIFASALAPNLLRPLVDYVFFHVTYTQPEMVNGTTQENSSLAEEPLEKTDVRSIGPNHIQIEVVETIHGEGVARHSDLRLNDQDQIDQFFDDVGAEELNLPDAHVVAVEADGAVDGATLGYFQDDDFEIVGLYRQQEAPYRFEASGEPTGLVGGMKRRHDPANPFTREATRAELLLREMFGYGADLDDIEDIDSGEVDGVGALPTLPCPPRPVNVFASSRPQSAADQLEVPLESQLDDVHPFYVAEDRSEAPRLPQPVDVEPAEMSTLIRPKSHAALRRLSVADDLVADISVADLKTASDFYGWFTADLPGSPGLRSPDGVDREQGLADDTFGGLWGSVQPPHTDDQHNSTDKGAGTTDVELFQGDRAADTTFCPVPTSLDHLFAAHQPVGAPAELRKPLPPSPDEHSDEDFGAEATSFWKSYAKQPDMILCADIQDVKPGGPAPGPHLPQSLPQEALSTSVAPLRHPDNKLFKRAAKKTSSFESEALQEAHTWHRSGAAALVLLNSLLCILLWSTLSPLDSTAGSNCGLFSRVFAAAMAVDLLILQQVVLLLKAASRWLNANPEAEMVALGVAHPYTGQRRGTP
jgi:hypothetical protein